MVAVIMDVIGKAGGTPDFSDYDPGGVHVGALLTAVISFLVLAAVVYFVIVMPYTKASELMARDKDDELAPHPRTSCCSPRSATCSRPRVAQVRCPVGSSRARISTGLS